jgi:hypothetical protein
MFPLQPSYSCAAIIVSALAVKEISENREPTIW